ncbi:MAG: SseB family protein [Actinobacteria bacterium]|nr:SseB family protein [Actinomycetota bacterium]
MSRFGTEILTSEFSGDDGSADPELLEALKLHSLASASETEQSVINVLKKSRLLVPVVAQIESNSSDNIEKDSYISQVTFKSADGRVGLPVFTSLQTLKEWNSEARPIAQWANAIALTCVESNIDAMLIDMSSEYRFALQGLPLLQLANTKN